MTDVVSVVRDLIAIPSVSSESNEPLIEYARRYFSSGAWRVDLYSYEDTAGLWKVNLVATFRCDGKSEAELALVCHTDTVPFDPAWTEAMCPVERGGNVYGRGSCDVKGFLASILASVARFQMGDLKKPLMVVLTSDEEIGRIGMKYLAGKEAVRARLAIVGEPTGLCPVSAGKGYGLGEIIVRGKEAHSAFPARGRSAIEDAARVVIALDNVRRELKSREAPDFNPPYTTLNVGLIQGGTAKNIVPGECRMAVEWRPVPDQDAELVPTLITGELKRLRETFPGFDADLQVRRFDPAFAPARTNELASFLSGLTGNPTETISFGSEASHFPADEVVVFGPGDMTTAHRTGEFVPVSELRQSMEYLTACIERFCGPVGQPLH